MAIETILATIMDVVAILEDQSLTRKQYLKKNYQGF